MRDTLCLESQNSYLLFQVLLLHFGMLFDLGEWSLTCPMEGLCNARCDARCDVIFPQGLGRRQPPYIRWARPCRVRLLFGCERLRVIPIGTRPDLLLFCNKPYYSSKNSVRGDHHHLQHHCCLKDTTQLWAYLSPVVKFTMQLLSYQSLNSSCYYLFHCVNVKMDWLNVTTSLPQAGIVRPVHVCEWTCNLSVNCTFSRTKRLFFDRSIICQCNEMCDVVNQPAVRAILSSFLEKIYHLVHLIPTQ